MEDFREIVQAIRKAHPQKFDEQKVLAKEFGLSRQSINQYLASGRIPYPYLHRFMKSRDYSLDSLYYDGEIQPSDYKRRVSYEDPYIHFEMNNDAMSPTFNKGDVLIAEPCSILEGNPKNIEMERIPKSGIFLIKGPHNSIHCCRIIRKMTMGERSLQLRKDNSNYPSEDITEDELIPMLVGKVIRVIKTVD